MSMCAIDNKFPSISWRVGLGSRCHLTLSHTTMELSPKDSACMAQSQALGCWE